MRRAWGDCATLEEIAVRDGRERDVTRRRAVHVTAVVFALAVASTGCGAAPIAPAGASVTAVPSVAPDGVRHVAFAYSDVAPASPAAVDVPRNATVMLVVGSDVTDQVQLSGAYSRAAFVTAGATVALTFVANVPGRIDVRLVRRDVTLGTLLVTSSTPSSGSSRPGVRPAP
jgi:hypothetical protein